MRICDDLTKKTENNVGTDKVRHYEVQENSECALTSSALGNLMVVTNELGKR